MSRAVLTEAKAPEVPADYPLQRYFTSTSGLIVLPKRDSASSSRVRVFRSGDKDFAELSLRYWPFGEMGVELDAAELKELAAHLLDAAADLESLPAEVLARAHRSEQAA